MGKTHERIDGRLRTFIEAQPMFFTATAPLDAEGTVNLSPKGLRGSFAVLDEHTVAYLDFAGSNAETVAHLRACLRSRVGSGRGVRCVSSQGAGPFS